MSRRRAAAMLAFVCASVIATVGFQTVVDAATFVDAGWWDRNNGAPLGGTGPPPDGAIRVQQDLNGPSAVAAVRYVLASDETAPVLRLRVTGAAATGTAGFVACRVSNDWAGADGGPWGERAMADCAAGQTRGKVSGDGTLVEFVVGPLASSGVVDVVISPAPTGGDPVANSFTTDFASPSGADMQTTPRPTTTTTTTTSPPPTTPPTTSAQFTPPPTTAPAPATTTTTTAASVAVTTDSVALTPTPTTAPDTTDVAVGPLDSGDSDGENGNRRPLALAVALAIAGFGGYLWTTERNRPPEDDAMLGGLGAFRKPRSSAAPEVN